MRYRVEGLDEEWMREEVVKWDIGSEVGVGYWMMVMISRKWRGIMCRYGLCGDIKREHEKNVVKIRGFEIKVKGGGNPFRYMVIGGVLMDKVVGEIWEWYKDNRVERGKKVVRDKRFDRLAWKRERDREARGYKEGDVGLIEDEVSVEYLLGLVKIKVEFIRGVIGGNRRDIEVMVIGGLMPKLGQLRCDVRGYVKRYAYVYKLEDYLYENGVYEVKRVFEEMNKGKIFEKIVKKEYIELHNNILYLHNEKFKGEGAKVKKWVGRIYKREDTIYK